MIAGIEARAAYLRYVVFSTLCVLSMVICCRRSGACKEWLGRASVGIRQLSANVNGPLLHELAAQIGFVDTSCIEFFRTGAGINCCLNLVRVACTLVRGAPLLDDGEGVHLAECTSSNMELLASLREDQNGSELHKIAMNDWKLHRMSMPVRATEVDTSKVPCISI